MSTQMNKAIAEYFKNMREPVRDRERLEHIKDAIVRIQENIRAVSLDNLSSNVLVFYGIMKNIEIIDEAA